MNTRIVFEAGPTHSGIDEALKLVDVASVAGADAIKFQLVDADRLVADREKLIGYSVLVNGKMAERSESLHRILKRRELAKEDWHGLRDAAANEGLGFYCTACYEDEFDFLVEDLGVDAIKVASADIDNLPLLRYLAHYPPAVEIHIDTGSANIWEVDRAVDLLSAPVIHHVPSGYPAHLPSIHLRVIQALRMMYPEHTIGFSDHSPGWEMDIAAIALGAQLVEKTITLDCRRPEIEHSFSLEPEDAKTFVSRIEDLEVALGSTRRTIPEYILWNRQGYRRGIYLSKPVREGERIEEVELRRPRLDDGIPPEFLEWVKGREVKKTLPAGALRWEDV